MTWAREWINPRFGPIVSTRATRVDALGWHIVIHRLGRPTFGSRIWHHVELSASGCSPDADQADERSLGEAVERYAAIDHDYRDEVAWMRGTDPESLLARFPACRHDEPCPTAMTRKRPESHIGHCLVRELGTGKPAWAPAGFVHLNYQPAPGEPVVTPAISTGLAYQRTRWTAIWAGLCEVVERDALMLAWWTRRALPSIQLDDTTPWEVLDRHVRLRDAGLTVDLYDMSSDMPIASVLAVLRADAYPYLTVGAGANTSPGAACAKAMDEAVSVRWSLRGQPRRTLPGGTDYRWVRSLSDHAELYAAWPEGLDYLRNGTSVTLADLAARRWMSPPTSWHDAESIGLRMADVGYRVYWVELDPPSVGAQGHVVKVLVPDLVPLSQDHAIRWLATPRLAGALQASGQPANPDPHPFA